MHRVAFVVYIVGLLTRGPVHCELYSVPYVIGRDFLILRLAVATSSKVRKTKLDNYIDHKVQFDAGHSVGYVNEFLICDPELRLTIDTKIAREADVYIYKLYFREKCSYGLRNHNKKAHKTQTYKL